MKKTDRARKRLALHKDKLRVVARDGLAAVQAGTAYPGTEYDARPSPDHDPQ